MKIGMDVRTWDKIAKTLMSVDKMAKFEYLGDGSDEGVLITTSSPGYSFCSVHIARGWAEAAKMDGIAQEKFGIDLSDLRAALQKVKGSSKSDSVVLESGGDNLLLVGNGSEIIDKRRFEENEQRLNLGEFVRFRMGGSKVKRILNEIYSTDDTVKITLGEYRINTKIGPDTSITEGYGVCFWKSEADEIFVSNEPLTSSNIKLEEFPDGFTTEYFVEPLTDIINEIGTARKESMEISIGPQTPIEMKFRLAETVFVEYTQVPKKVVELPEVEELEKGNL